MSVKKEDLKLYQSKSLEEKIEMSKERIRIWYEYWDGSVFVSFSGGKDSTVLLDLVRSIYPEVKGMFLDTGLEWPEIRQFVKQFDNIDWVRPKMPFHKVIDKYGYPIISKDVAQKLYEIRTTKSDKLLNKRLYGDVNKNGKIPEKWKFLIDAPFKISHNCCNILKKNPSKKYERESRSYPYIGTMTVDSSTRISSYLRIGCNGFDLTRPRSTPLAFWYEKDIWDYIKKFNLPYSPIYNTGLERTGCMYCLFGMHMERGKNKRFDIMKQLHPKHYNFCMNKLGISDILKYINKEKSNGNI